MRYLFIIIFLFYTAIPAGASDKPLDRTDKLLFTALCAAQVADGLTTAAHLSHGHNYIVKPFAWKYGATRPSPARLWAVKVVEIGGAYYIGRRLSGKNRKYWFGFWAVVLFVCAANNQIEFKVTY